MKSIRTFISTSREFDAIRRGLLDLLKQLNREYLAHGVEFIPTGPREGARDADIAVILYGTDYGDMPQNEFDKAYAAFKAGNKPIIHVFFRDSDQSVSGAMAAFRDSFAKRYGHFYCHFETLDTLKFQVVAQSLAFLPGGEAVNPLKIEGSQVCLGNSPIADLGQLPFAKLNSHRRSLIRRLGRADDEVAELVSQVEESGGDADVKGALEDARAERRELQDELARYEQFLLGAAVFFAKESGGKWNERTRKARNLFERGLAKEANELLDFREMLEQDRRDSKAYQAARETRIQNLNGFWAKSQLVLVDHTLPRTEQFKQSLACMEQAVRIALEIHHDREKTGEMLFGVAALLQTQNRIRESAEKYGEALEIFRELAREKPECREVVSAILGNRAILCHKSGDIQGAEKNLVQALEISRALADRNPVYGRHVGAQLRHLALIHSEMRRDRAAEEEFRESAEWLRRRAEEDPEPEDAEVELAQTLANHGRFQRFVLGRLPDAEANYSRALRLLRRHADRNRLAGQHLASVLAGLGGIHRVQKKLREADAETLEAVELAQRLADENPEEYEPWLVNALRERANLEREQGRTRDAERDFERIVELCERIRRRQPSMDMVPLAGAYEELAKIRFSDRRFGEAETAYRRALALYRECARTRPAMALPSVAGVLQGMAFLHVNMNRAAEAAMEFDDAAETYQRLARENPGAFAARWLEAMDMRAVAYAKIGLQDKAEQAFRELLAALEGMAEGRPDAFAPKIADVLDKLAGIHLAGQKWAQAEDEYARSLAWRRRIPSRESEEETHQSARQNLALALARQRQGKDSALAPAREARELYERLSRSRPGQYEEELSTARQIVSQMARARNARPQPRPGFLGRLFGPGRTVVCPVCGGERSEKETVRCPKCGRSGLCPEHLDRRTGICGDCVRVARERHAREEAERRAREAAEARAREEEAQRKREAAERQEQSPLASLFWIYELDFRDKQLMETEGFAFMAAYQRWEAGGRRGPEPRMSPEMQDAWTRILPVYRKYFG
ncbi:MAG: hypothetical protein IK066_06900 [Kiritimatiellae bacterium]|nr:hypothetical protein [Kiritimatiellia bacterium]